MTFSDLAVEAFMIIREAYFDQNGTPIRFSLREKRNTQDNPLDQHIAATLTSHLVNAQCVTAPGPLISPDLVLFREELCNTGPRDELRTDLTRIVAIEVKKLERGTGGIARSTGLDYNTTPPCGTVRIYDATIKPVDIRGFYLFVCQETASTGENYLTALVLTDGNILNDDFEFYLSITNQRTKRVGLGTYGDGVNRERPMLIFSNPLGVPEFDHKCTLIHPTKNVDSRLRLSYVINRTSIQGQQNTFFAHQSSSDLGPNWSVPTLLDPFPQPQNRVEQTQSRGRFRVPIQPLP